MIRPIIIDGQDGSDILHRRSLPVTHFDTSLHDLIDDLWDTMYKSKGIGLAAPQIGNALRVCVVDVGGGDDPDDRLTLINPRIVTRSGTHTDTEGCLSIPKQSWSIARSLSIKVTSVDMAGRLYHFSTVGLEARAIQHEIDHLDGILCPDRALIEDGKS